MFSLTALNIQITEWHVMVLSPLLNYHPNFYPLSCMSVLVCSMMFRSSYALVIRNCLFCESHSQSKIPYLHTK